MNKKQQVGVVTVTHNSADFIDAFMASVLAQTHQEFIFYVIDNASSDDTLNRIERHTDARIVVIKNHENVGVAAGNNQGIKAALEAICDDVLLINNDTEFGPQLFEKLIKALEKYQCDMTAPKMMYHANPKMIWYAGGQFNRGMAHTVDHYGKGEVDQGKYSVARRVEYAPTCCLLIKKSVFDLIGLMDEKYFVYFDDADFCFRAVRSSLTLYYIPDAELRHRVSASTGGEGSTFVIKYCTRNNVYFAKKYQNLITFLIWLFLNQCTLLTRLFLGRDNWKMFFLKQKSFLEGAVL